MRAIFLTLLMLALAGCEAARSKASMPDRERRFVATAVGRTDSANEARHLIAEVDGAIGRIFVNRGDAVASGDALLSVNCDTRLQEVSAQSAATVRATAAARRVYQAEHSAEIAAADAQIEAAQAALLEQEQKLVVATDLSQREFFSKRELATRINGRDAARAQLAMAKANRAHFNDQSRPAEIAEAKAAVRVAAAQTGVARAQARQCVLRSPVDGVVLQILRREGEFSGASQGTPLIVVGDLRQMVVRTEINERDAAAVYEGQKARIWVDGQQTQWRGRVSVLASIMGRRTARSLDPTDRFDRDTREVFVSFEGPHPPPLVGLRVTVGLLK
jgi:HlyD family secretion protein